MEWVPGPKNVEKSKKIRVWARRAGFCTIGKYAPKLDQKPGLVRSMPSFLFQKVFGILVLHLCKGQHSFSFFDVFLGRYFRFSILLRRGPGLGPGAGPGSGPGACEEGWKMCFFQMGFRAVTQHRHNSQPPPTHFQTLQYRRVSLLANGDSLYPHL